MAMEGAVENSKSKRTRNDLEEVDDDACYGTTRAKKPRIRWTTHLHEKFLQAIAVIIERKNPYKRFGSSNGFGESQVFPKEILEEMRKMGVEGLNRHNVSSHLQKHRATCTSNTKNKGGELLDQQQLDTNAADSSYLSQCYYMPIMESDSSAPAVAALYQYPDADHYYYPFPRNSAVNYPMQQPKTYFNLGIAQQIDPPPIAQQLMIPLNQPSIWNPGGCNFGIGTAPRKLPFSRAPSTCFGSQNQTVTMPGPHSANRLGFSAQNDHSEFIGRGPYVYSTDTLPSVRANCLQEPSGLYPNITTGTCSTASPPSLSSIDYQSPEAAPKIIKTEVNFPLQHACVRPGTTTTATNDRISIGNSEAPATLCDQDTGLLGLDGLDLPWLENLIGEESDLN